MPELAAAEPSCVHRKPARLSWARLLPRAGLRVRSEIDTNLYPKGSIVSDVEFAAINIERDAFHGEWNYSIGSG